MNIIHISNAEPRIKKMVKKAQKLISAGNNKFFNAISDLGMYLEDVGYYLLLSDSCSQLVCSARRCNPRFGALLGTKNIPIKPRKPKSIIEKFHYNNTVGYAVNINAWADVIFKNGETLTVPDNEISYQDLNCLILNIKIAYTLFMEGDYVSSYKVLKATEYYVEKINTGVKDTKINSIYMKRVPVAYLNDWANFCNFMSEHKDISYTICSANPIKRQNVIKRKPNQFRMYCADSVNLAVIKNMYDESYANPTELSRANQIDDLVTVLLNEVESEDDINHSLAEILMMSMNIAKEDNLNKKYAFIKIMLPKEDADIVNILNSKVDDRYPIKFTIYTKK